MTAKPSAIRVVVDRREGSTLVFIDDSDNSYEAPASKLPKDCRREGAVMDVPLDAQGQPLWGKATRNSAEEEARLRDVKQRLDRLRETDPGGDVEL